MQEFYAQGDLLIERVNDVTPTGSSVQPALIGACVLLEGERTGHHHAINECVTMFRDDGLARDIPTGLYIGHVRVDQANARVVHEEHAPISLPPGTYRVRRQRELEPKDARLVAD